MVFFLQMTVYVLERNLAEDVIVPQKPLTPQLFGSWQAVGMAALHPSWPLSWLQDSAGKIFREAALGAGVNTSGSCD